MPLRLPKRKQAAPDPAATAGFSITCECGTSHEGQRRKRHQQIICNECAAPLFVLPIDVYPPPVARSKNAPKSGGGLSSAIAAPAVALRSGTRGVATAASGAASGAARSSASFARWLFTPLKVAVLSVALVAGVTGYLLHRQSAIADAERVARVSTAAGFEALQSRDFVTASEHLNAAVDAIDYAGMVPTDARRIRQAARETTALANPASGSLIDLLDDVASAGTDSRGYWQRPQQFGYMDSWLIMDANVTRSRSDNRTRTRIALPLRVGEEGKPVRVVAKADALADVPLSESPTLLTLAAQVQSVREFEKGWEVRLNPETLFLWETPSLYREAGFDFDPLVNPEQSVLLRLEEQRRWQGASPNEPPVDAEEAPSVGEDIAGERGDEADGKESGDE